MFSTVQLKEGRKCLINDTFNTFYLLLCASVQLMIPCISNRLSNRLVVLYVTLYVTLYLITLYLVPCADVGLSLSVKSVTLSQLSRTKEKKEKLNRLMMLLFHTER